MAALTITNSHSNGCTIAQSMMLSAQRKPGRRKRRIGVVHPSPNTMLELAWAVRVPRVDAVQGSAGGGGCLNVWRDVELVRFQEKPGGGNRAHLHFRPPPPQSVRNRLSQPSGATRKTRVSQCNRGQPFRSRRNRNSSGDRRNPRGGWLWYVPSEVADQEKVPD